MDTLNARSEFLTTYINLISTISYLISCNFMSTFFTFKNLVVWQKSMELAKLVLELFENCKYFALKDQIMRSAISVPSNIAE